MEKKGKIIIAVVAVILVILVGGYLYLTSMPITLQGFEAEVKVPSNYSLDDKGVATAGNTSVIFTGVTSSDKSLEDNIFKAIQQNGKEAGYKNVSKSNVNGFKVYEYAAFPDKLKNVSTNEVETSEGTSWMTFEPYKPFGNTTAIHHYRMLTYQKDGNINYLTFYTNDPNTSLYTSEIDTIINSIAPIQK